METEMDVIYNDFRANADRVAANPTQASKTDLLRAASYLNHKRTSLVHRNPNVSLHLLSSIDAEIAYYDSLIGD